MKAEAVWAEAPTGEGDRTWDTEPAQSCSAKAGAGPKSSAGILYQLPAPTEQGGCSTKVF